MTIDNNFRPQHSICSQNHFIPLELPIYYFFFAIPSLSYKSLSHFQIHHILFPSAEVKRNHFIVKIKKIVWENLKLKQMKDETEAKMSINDSTLLPLEVLEDPLFHHGELIAKKKCQNNRHISLSIPRIFIVNFCFFYLSQAWNHILV